MTRGFDKDALRFYLEHAEETRLEREKFLRGEEVDPAIIPPYIYESWIRCGVLGVNPYTSDLAPQTPVLRSADQLLPGLPKMLQGTSDFFRAFGFQVAIFDEAGNLVTDREKTGTILQLRGALEASIGTASSSIAFARRLPSCCFGYQNYKSPFCRQFGVSLPVMCDDTLLAIVTAILDPDRLSQELYERAIAFLEMMEQILLSGIAQKEAAVSLMELFQKSMSHFSDGIVIASRDQNEVQINPAAKKLIPMSPGESQRAMLHKLELASQGRYKKNAEFSTVSVSEEKNDYGKIYVLKNCGGKRGATAPTTERAKYSFRELLGEDPAFLAAKNEAFVVAGTNAPVMLIGDTGVGKELFAQAIHNASPRKDKPFVAINCGSVAKNLLESELFGYEAGAFTGALTQGKIGVMEAASGGTLFLDEIESMPLQAQAALLRCLSSNSIRRIGSVKSIPIDLRLIAATKVDLLSDRGGDWGVKFRPDLYYRLSTCIVNIPRLSERRSDITVLAKHLIEKERMKMGYADITVSESFWDSLRYYSWPGNVRELENVVARAVIFMDPERRVLERSLLYPKILEESDRRRIEIQGQLTADELAPNGTLRQEEALTLQRFLTKHHYNVKDTAADLGISRQTLYRKIQSNEALRLFMEQHKKERKNREV